MKWFYGGENIIDKEIFLKDVFLLKGKNGYYSLSKDNFEKKVLVDKFLKEKKVV